MTMQTRTVDEEESHEQTIKDMQQQMGLLEHQKKQEIEAVKHQVCTLNRPYHYIHELETHLYGDVSVSLAA